MDIWDVDQWGKIISRIENKDLDQIRLVNHDGSQRQDKEGNDLTLEFDYGTIESQETISTGKESNFDVYKVRGDANATKFFEFLSDNISIEPSQVEFSHIMTGTAGDQGLNFITSGHTKGSEPGMTYLYLNQLQYGYNIRSMTHSHPLDTNFGNNDNSFIEGIVKEQIRKGFYIPDFYIYHVPSKTYIKK